MLTDISLISYDTINKNLFFSFLFMSTHSFLQILLALYDKKVASLTMREQQQQPSSCMISQCYRAQQQPHPTIASTSWVSELCLITEVFCEAAFLTSPFESMSGGEYYKGSTMMNTKKKNTQNTGRYDFVPEHGQGQQVVAGNIPLYFFIIIYRPHIIKLSSYIFAFESIYINIKMLIIHLFLIKY